MKRSIQLLLVLVIILASRELSGSRRTPGLWDSNPLLYSHLVIRGRVENIDYNFVPLADLGAGPPEAVLNKSVEIGEVNLEVYEVLKGSTESTTVQISGLRHIIGSLSPGTEVIIAVYYTPEINKFTIPSDDCIFVGTSRQWVRQSDFQYFNIIELENTIKLSRLEHIVGIADVVVVGEVISTSMKYEGTHKERVSTQRVTMSVNQSIKGSINTSEVIFDMTTHSMKAQGAFPKPVLMLPGDTFYVFLKYRNDNLLLFAGINGALKQVDDSLIYDNVVPYYLDKTTFTNKLTSEMSQER